MRPGPVDGTDSLGAAPEREQPKRQRMDMLTRALVLRLREGDDPLPCDEIARRLDISESSVRRIIQSDAADHKAGIRRVMRTADLEMLELWMEGARVQAAKGYFQAMQAWLEADGSIDAKSSAAVSVDARPTLVLHVPYTLGALKDYKPEEHAPAIDTTAVDCQAAPAATRDE